jgi:hypothetical protein
VARKMHGPWAARYILCLCFCRSTARRLDLHCGICNDTVHQCLRACLSCTCPYGDWKFHTDVPGTSHLMPVVKRLCCACAVQLHVLERNAKLACCALACGPKLPNHSVHILYMCLLCTSCRYCATVKSFPLAQFKGQLIKIQARFRPLLSLHP